VAESVGLINRKERDAMKIQIVQKGTQKVSSKAACPWYVDEPPAAKK
jgi:hypothetical protein